MELEEYIENEWYLVRHSGEIPEIALNSALYYLSRDKKGPQINLDDDILSSLRKAAEERFHEIVLRDLDYDNRDKTIYRGVERAIANLQRYKDFCNRHKLSSQEFNDRVGKQFAIFIAAIKKDDTRCRCETVLNCTFEDLLQFAKELGLSETDFLEPLHNFCCGQVEVTC